MIGLLNVDAVFAGYLFICLSLSLVCLGFGIAAQEMRISKAGFKRSSCFETKSEGRNIRPFFLFFFRQR